MKAIFQGFLTILFLQSFTVEAKKIYFLSKEEFIHHFTDKKPDLTIQCTNEEIQKVWLQCNTNTIMSVRMKNAKNQEIILHTIRVKNNVIEAVKFNVWIPKDVWIKIPLDSVESFRILRMFQESETNFIQIDSSKMFVRSLNDSLAIKCAATISQRIEIANEKPNQKPWIIAENACYHLKFKDSKTTIFGIVQRISNDSIVISNYFNEEMAKANKTTFEIYTYPIKEMLELLLLKPGGYSFKKIIMADHIWRVEKVEPNKSGCPLWYALNKNTGSIHLYRSWLTDTGFTGVTEIGGKAIWYEGEMY